MVNDQYYHILTKSIAAYVIFNNHFEFDRFILTLKFYQHNKNEMRLSKFIEAEKIHHLSLNDIIGENKLVEIIAYCIMPTHIHLLVKQLYLNGISIFMNNVLNSYSRFFNTSHGRKGPLYEGRFKSVLVKDDSQLLHLSRYIHLNPVSAGIVERPDDWAPSSYLDYLGKTLNPISKSDIMDIDPERYEKFVKERINYQRELTKIKQTLLD